MAPRGGRPTELGFCFFFFFFFSDLARFLLGCRGGLRWLVGWFEVGRSGSRWGGVAWRGLAVGRVFGSLPQPNFFFGFFFSIFQIYLIFRCCRWVI
jgi:hypothetical protein